MHFEVEHRFTGITVADYEKLYFDEAFNEALCQSVKLERTLVKLDQQGPKLHRQVKVSPDRELPAAAAKVIGTTKIVYTEHCDYAFGGYRGTWKTVSGIMADKIASSGTFSFRQEGNAVVRRVDGDVKVNVNFMINPMIEKGILSDVEKSYQQAAEFTQRWINNGGKA
jgi:hypothetical protein